MEIRRLKQRMKSSVEIQLVLMIYRILADLLFFVCDKHLHSAARFTFWSLFLSLIRLKRGFTFIFLFLLREGTK